MRKNTIRKFLSTICLCTLLISTINITASAKSPLKNDTSSEDDRAVTDGTTIWSVTSKTNLGTSYGSWRSGPSAYGPGGTLSISKHVTASNTISGSYSSKADIALALGFSIGVSFGTTVTSTSDQLPAGHHEYRYRERYTKYKVIQTQYTRLDGKNYSTGKTQTCYVYKFQNWDFKLFKID